MDRWISRYDAIPTHVNTVKVFNHVYAEEKRKFYGKEKSMLSRVSCDEGIKQELKREYSLSRSRLRKISSYQPTECPGINSSNGRKVWSIVRSNVRRTPVRLWSRSDRGWYSLTSEEEPRTRPSWPDRVSRTSIIHLLDRRPPFLRIHSSSRSGNAHAKRKARVIRSSNICSRR